MSRQYNVVLHKKFFVRFLSKIQVRISVGNQTLISSHFILVASCMPPEDRSDLARDRSELTDDQNGHADRS